MTDLETLSAGMLGAVPFARTLGVEFTAVADGGGTVTARLPDAEQLHNHVGGPHAAAMFGLAETASGAVVMAVFADQLDRAVPLGEDDAPAAQPGRSAPPFQDPPRTALRRRRAAAANSPSSRSVCSQPMHASVTLCP